MTELQKFIETKFAVSEQTKKNYNYQYKSIRQLLEDDIINSTEEQILEAVKTLSNAKPSNEWTYMNLPYMIRLMNDKEIDKIQQRREELKVLRDNYEKEQKIIKNQTLPLMKDVKNYVKELLNKKDYIKYVINFLIMNYGVRNKDVDTFIVSSIKEVNDETINYLVVKKTEVEWIINDYKTKFIYGAKKIIIKSKFFIEVMSLMPKNVWLLNGKEQRLNESSLAMTIKRILYNNLTEGDYFKIIMNDINTKPNTLKLLKFYSKTRGTSLDTLLKYYDVATDDEIIID
jgi:hypothetical protein